MIKATFKQVTDTDRVTIRARVRVRVCLRIWVRIGSGVEVGIGVCDMIRGTPSVVIIQCVKIT